MLASPMTRQSERHATLAVDVGGVMVGGGAPIVVQSMTNTDTADVARTTARRSRRWRGPARRSCASRSIATRRPRPCRTSASGWRGWACACRSSAISTTTATRCWPTTRPAPRRSTSTASIPATSASRTRRTGSSPPIIELALKYGKPVRIGVNWGSLDQELLTHLMDENAKRADADARARRDARGDRAVGAAVGRARRGAGPRRRPHHHLGQGLGGAGPDRGLHACWPRAAAMRCISA